jgi:phosphoribosylformylglycinamidine synthase subunit PurSL
VGVVVWLSGRPSLRRSEGSVNALGGAAEPVGRVFWFPELDAISTEVLQHAAGVTLGDAPFFPCQVCEAVPFDAWLVCPRQTTDTEAVFAENELRTFLGLPEAAVLSARSASLYDGEPTINPASALVRQVRQGESLTTHLAAASALTNPGSGSSATLSWQPASDTRLSLEEWHALAIECAEQRHARLPIHLGDVATKTEREALAQIWSEHCKHKEFRGVVHLREGTGHVVTIDSLFDTFVRQPSEEVRDRYRARGVDFVISMFEDNAGVIRVAPNLLLTLKVETHNAPSAIEPVQGAMTGILGAHRDAIAIAEGQPRLLFSTDVLCFGEHRDYRVPLSTQLHPRVVETGVIEGIARASNHSGIPTIAGSVVYNACFFGRPLVFCGAAAVFPEFDARGNRFCGGKDVRAGDVVVLVGNRTGRDGIGGAAMSSHVLGGAEPTISSTSRRASVQVGDPFVQQQLRDFLSDASSRFLIRALTDNGAGGLACSVSDLAQYAGGVSLDLDRVVRCEENMDPWELLISESQERMTLAVPQDSIEQLLALARAHGVVAASIGVFEDTGAMRVFATLQGSHRCVASLRLAFLQHGVPRKQLVAEVPNMAPNVLATVTPDQPRGSTSQAEDWVLSFEQRTTCLRDALCTVLARDNVRSKESIVRRFDHEVQGRSVVRAYHGDVRGARSPQDVGVVSLAGFLQNEGAEWPRDSAFAPALAVAHGIAPKFVPFDAEAAAHAAFDEAFRSLIGLGAEVPWHSADPCFAACDNFCVPDSVVSPDNPDGGESLVQLVQLARALAAMIRAFEVPMISGKDSMKNDFREGATRLSILPTLLITMVARTTKIVTSEFKNVGDKIYLLGRTYDDELLGSEFWSAFGPPATACSADRAPRIRVEPARDLYERLTVAHRRALLASVHDVSDGGAAVALVEACFAANVGCNITLPDERGLRFLFSESLSRFVVSVARENEPAFRELFGELAQALGEVVAEPLITMTLSSVRDDCEKLPPALSLSLVDALRAYQGELNGEFDDVCTIVCTMHAGDQ